MKLMHLSSIGHLILMLTLCTAQPSTAHAAESTSFVLEAASIAPAQTGLQSESYNGQGTVNWHTNTLTGNTFQIVPTQAAGQQASAPSPSSFVSSAASSVASVQSSSAQQEEETHGGGRGGTRSSADIAEVSRSSRSSVRTSSRRSQSSSRSSHASSTEPDTHSSTTGNSSAVEEGSSSSAIQSIDEQLFPASDTPYTSPEIVDGQGSSRTHSSAATLRPAAPLFPIATQTSIPAAIGICIALIVTVGMCIPRVRLDLSALWMLPIELLLLRATQKNALVRMAFALLAIAVVAVIVITSILAVQQAGAASVPVSHSYDGRLLHSSGSAITSSVNIRLSYWSNADVQPGDVAGDGSLNTSATHYLTWQETHTVTPDSNGYFSVEMGSISALPAYSSFPAGTSVFLQVEVKTASGANTDFEILDPVTADSAVDRTAILSVPYASMAETLQHRTIGTGSGSLPLLQSGGLLPVSTIPDGTNRDTFTIDANNDGQDIALQFGTALAETLTFSTADGRFEFSDDVHIEGNLTVTGTVNGIDLSTLDDPQTLDRLMVLHPAYQSAAFQGDGTDNIGQLAVSHDNLSLKNFYTWTSTRTSLQDYDVLLRFTLPDDFIGWDDSMNVEYRTTSADPTNNKLDIQVYDTSGVPVTLSGSAVNLAGTSWSSTHLEFTGTPTWTPGQEILVRLKVYAKDSFQLHLGDILMSLNELE